MTIRKEEKLEYFKMVEVSYRLRKKQKWIKIKKGCLKNEIKLKAKDNKRN